MTMTVLLRNLTRNVLCVIEMFLTLVIPYNTTNVHN